MFFFFSFFFYKIGEQEGGTSPALERGRVGTSGRGEVVEKAVGVEYGANTVCTCM
jgi:hypothetical protein